MRVVVVLPTMAATSLQWVHESCEISQLSELREIEHQQYNYSYMNAEGSKMYGSKIGGFLFACSKWLESYLTKLPQVLLSMK